MSQANGLDFVQDQSEVQRLIQVAHQRGDGLEFLMKGPLEAVAIGFESHVFAVEEARRMVASAGGTAGAGTASSNASLSPRKSKGLPTSVTLCECWARDGLQSIPKFIPTAQKIEMLNRMTDCGMPKMEVTSFSHPKLLPQFSDAVEVLKGIRRKPGTSYVVLMPNIKGFERLTVCQEEGYGATEIILMISSSEKHNMLNFRASHVEAMREHAEIMRRAHKMGIKVIGCAGTVYGCPVGGDMTTEQVAKIVKFYLDEGAQTIMLGDTTGVANPLLVKRRIGELIDLFPSAEYIAHFHDTRGTGVANSIAALELGLRYVDSSIGAIGGQPATGAAKYSLGHTGNTCSEDLVGVIQEMGIQTGVDLSQLIEAGRRAEEIVGQRLRSNIIYSGPVIHGESRADKGPGAAVSLNAN